MKPDQFIERRIIIGMITSSDYLREIESVYSPDFIEANAARMIAGWIWEYFNKYQKAPGKDIEGIYAVKLRSGDIQEEQSDFIEGILENLSDEYDRKKFNLEYLLDQTREYFRIQRLQQYADTIRAEVDVGNLTEAENIALSYQPMVRQTSSTIDPFDLSLSEVKKVFDHQSQPLVKFPKALGKFLNESLTRDSLVAFMGPEKVGKTFMLLEIALRSLVSGCNVALFQAGDMSQSQQLMRLYIYLNKRSNKPNYCEGMWVPVVDCWYNQTDTCTNKNRESDFGIFTEGRDPKLITLEDLVEAKNQNPDYRPCRNCKNMLGAPWIRWQSPVNPLTPKEAYKSTREWKRKHKKDMRLSTYANENLSVSEIKGNLDLWERQEGFVPDVIVIDYADILTSDPDCQRLDWRNQNNRIWQRLRNLSQERHCLVVTATQSAATSYKKENIDRSDFSEDKRKYAHATAFYSLNQLPHEKKIGVMRIGEIMIRERDFDVNRQIKVLQRLEMGKPFLGSYF